MDSRERNDVIEEGRYSESVAAGAPDDDGVVGRIKGKTFFERDAARDNMAVRCGVLLVRTPSVLSEDAGLDSGY